MKKNCNCGHQINAQCSKIYVDENCNLYINDTSETQDFVYVFVVKHSTYTEEDPTVVLIKVDQFQELKVLSQGDGLYTILKLTVPLDSSKPYYYYDGNFYKGDQIVDLQELIDVNPEVSEIPQEYIYYFSTCKLRKCYISVIQDIFKAHTTICKAPQVDNNLIYRRDLLWMTLNIIQYMAELEQFDEAKRLLMEVTECNGICPPEKSTNACGCSR